MRSERDLLLLPRRVGARLPCKWPQLHDYRQVCPQACRAGSGLHRMTEARCNCYAIVLWSELAAGNGTRTFKCALWKMNRCTLKVKHRLLQTSTNNTALIVVCRFNSTQMIACESVKAGFRVWKRVKVVAHAANWQAPGYYCLLTMCQTSN